MTLTVTRTLKLQQNLFSTRTLSLSLLKSLSSISRERKPEDQDRREFAEEAKTHNSNLLLVHENREILTMDLDDYTIIKEGEAEILMHNKNKVFFNKAQVSKSFSFNCLIWFCLLIFIWISCLR